VAAVHSEIFVGCENKRVGEYFSHANKTSIGEPHWDVGVLLDQLHDRLEILGKFEGDDESAAPKKCGKAGCAARSHKVEGLGENSFACGPGRG
jgi:hypothetical protein